MVRSEIISKLSNRIHKKFKKSELGNVLDTILNSVIDGIAENKAAEWRTFGRFSPKKIKEKMGRNPRTNEKIYVPEKISVKFKMAKELKNKINQNESYTNRKKIFLLLAIFPTRMKRSN